MGRGKIEKLGLKTIADAVRGSDVATARDRLSAVVGAVVDVSGKVLKRVKRDGQCKLVIEPGDVPGFVVFADCRTDEKAVISRKNRKYKGGSEFLLEPKLSTPEATLPTSENSIDKSAISQLTSETPGDSLKRGEFSPDNDSILKRVESESAPQFLLSRKNTEQRLVPPTLC
jgi:hypothetical protein